VPVENDRRSKEAGADAAAGTRDDDSVPPVPPGPGSHPIGLVDASYTVASLHVGENGYTTVAKMVDGTTTMSSDAEPAGIAEKPTLLTTHVVPSAGTLVNPMSGKPAQEEDERKMEYVYCGGEAPAIRASARDDEAPYAVQPGATTREPVAIERGDAPALHVLDFAKSETVRAGVCAAAGAARRAMIRARAMLWLGRGEGGMGGE
jgi:hypothetical protein